MLRCSLSSAARKQILETGYVNIAVPDLINPELSFTPPVDEYWVRKYPVQCLIEVILSSSGTQVHRGLSDVVGMIRLPHVPIRPGSVIAKVAATIWQIRDKSYTGELAPFHGAATWAKIE